MRVRAETAASSGMLSTVAAKAPSDRAICPDACSFIAFFGQPPASCTSNPSARAPYHHFHISST
jgi:hypothetical protein